MDRIYLGGALLIGLIVGSSLAVPTRLYAQSPPPVTTSAKPQKPRIVCKEFDPPTGSHVGGGTVCRPEADWAADERQAQRAADAEVQRIRALHAYNQNQNPFSGPLPK